MTYTSRIITIFALCFSVTEGAYAYDITDAITATLKNNTNLNNSRITFEKNQLNRFAAATSFLPQIQAQASLSNTFMDGEISKNGTPNQQNLSIAQEIFSGGKGIYDLKSTKFSSEASVIQYQSDVDTTIVQTVQVYEAVLALRDIYTVSQQNVNSLKKIVKQSGIKLAVGAITKTNMLEAQAQLADAIAAQEKSYADMKSAEESFKYITGQIAPINMLEIDVSSIILPENLDIFLEKIDINNPSIQAANKNFQAIQFKTRSTKSMMLPKITANAGLNNQKQWGFDPRSNTMKLNSVRAAQYSLNMTLPLFQSGIEYVQIKNALLDEEAALNNKNDTLLKTQKDSASAWNDYMQTKLAVISASESAHYYQAFAEGADEEFKLGTKTLTDLLQAQVNAERARTKFIQYKAQLVISALNLKALLGEINTVEFKKLVMKKQQINTQNIEKVDKITEQNIENIASIAAKG